MIGVGRERGGLFHLLNKPVFSSISSVPSAQSFSVKTISFDVWHFRLGIKLLSQYDSSITVDSNNCCTICPLAKQHRLPFPVSHSLSNKIFDLLHCDIWGPFTTDSLHGVKYFLTIVDDYSRFTWVHLMVNKSQTRNLLVSFITQVETQFSTKVKILRSDNGLEFQLPAFYQSKGIIHQLSCDETPQQNSVVERKQQHLLNVARALKFQANLPLFFWGECVLSTAHIITEFLLISYPIKLLLNVFSQLLLVSLTFELLAVFVLLLLLLEIDPNLIPRLHLVFFLVTLIMSKVTSCLILLFMRIFFLIIPLSIF
jgi:hypothetical protein